MFRYGSKGKAGLEFGEPEATPQLLTKLSIQLHLADLSLSNTILSLEIFGAQCVRSTVHKADLSLKSGRSPDDVSVDETVIQIDDDQY